MKNLRCTDVELLGLIPVEGAPARRGQTVVCFRDRVVEQSQFDLVQTDQRNPLKPLPNKVVVQASPIVLGDRNVCPITKSSTAGFEGPENARIPLIHWSGRSDLN